MTIPEQAVPEEAAYAAAKAITGPLREPTEWELAQFKLALTAAAPHLAAVQVKKLVWTSLSTLTLWAQTPVGNFEITEFSATGLSTRLATPFSREMNWFESVDAAKAAAQADYEARILSALEPSAGRAAVLVNIDEIVQPLEDIPAPGGLCRWTDVATAIGEVRRALRSLEPSAARELALEEGYRQGIEAAAKLIECGCKALLHGKGECQFPGNCSLEDAAAIRALSSPDHADAGKVEGDGWKQIESAPNNKAILVQYDDGSIELISAHDNEYAWIAYTVKEDFCTKPTHWRPLPSAPSQEVTGS